ncbi:MAG: hypothetical protein KAS70_07850, partial [Planctomycetes bacterium]|nr:hypothetical protein [Planctomycetota bacterium]
MTRKILLIAPLLISLIVFAYGQDANEGVSSGSSGATQNQTPTAVPDDTRTYDWGGVTIVCEVYDEANTTIFFNGSITGQALYLYKITNNYYRIFTEGTHIPIHYNGLSGFNIGNRHNITVNNQFTDQGDWEFNAYSGGIEWDIKNAAGVALGSVGTFGFTVPAGAYEPEVYEGGNWTHTWVSYRHYIWQSRFLRGNLTGPVIKPVIEPAAASHALGPYNRCSLGAKTDGGSSVDYAIGNLNIDQNITHIAPTTGLPTNLTLYYNSLDDIIPGLPAGHEGTLGTNWTHTFNQSIIENQDGTISYRMGDGKRFKYEDSNGDSVYEPRAQYGDYSVITDTGT